MRIDSNTRSLEVAPTLTQSTSVPAPPSPPTSAIQGDRVELDASRSLNEAMAQTPAARAEKIARARELVADSSYPGKDVQEQVARVLAKGLTEQ